MTMNQQGSPVTRLLIELGAGDASAGEKLFPMVYEELHGLARRYMAGERRDHTWQATALVHEAYLRLVGNGACGATDRAHFIGVAARAMRQVLINHARDRAASKRGGGVRKRVPLDEVTAAYEAASVDLLALDEALTELRSLDPQQERIVELRFFAGLTLEEIAVALSISKSSVDRDWRMARAWLRCRIGTE